MLFRSQAALVQQLVKDLNLPGLPIVHPIVREADGLALSSRNVYLSSSERQAAPVLSRALQAGIAAIRAGERNAARIQRHMLRVVATEPLATVEYLAVCDPVTLEPLSQLNRQAVLLGAMRIGRVRLLDNMLTSFRRKP